MPVRRIALATSFGLALAALATPALAEGSWHSYLDKVLPGFDSRTWRGSYHFTVVSVSALSTSGTEPGCPP